MTKAIQVTQDSDGTFIISEPGQSPQKLTRRWEDLAGYLQGQFQVSNEITTPGEAYTDKRVSYPGNDETPSAPDPFDHDQNGKPGGSLKHPTKGNQPIPEAQDTTPVAKSSKKA